MTQLLDGTSQATISDSGIYESPTLLAPILDGSTIDPFHWLFVAQNLLNILGLARSQGKGGAYLTQAGVTVADIQAELWRITSGTLAEVADLDLSFGRLWTDILSEPGSGEISVMNDDPDEALIADTGNDLVLFKYKGWAAFMMICEQPDRVVIAETEEVDEATTWRGRGHLALLERGLVYPTLGVGKQPIEEDRQFNWTSPAYDHSGWAFAKVIMSVGSAKTGWNAGLGPHFDADFPDNVASVLWASSGTDNFAPTGHCWFRQVITVPTTGTYRVYALCDNSGDIYIDGQFLTAVNGGPTPTSADGFTNMTQADIDLSAGSHTIAARGYNAPLGLNNVNDPAGIAWSVWSVDAATGAAGSVVARSDATVRIVEYSDDPPGMTPGEAMILCLQEMQARGVLTGLTWTFTETADTDGAPWPITADIATKVGTDVLTFFRELAGTYVDLWMRPGQLILDAWNIGTRGGTSGVTLRKPTDPTNPSSGNLTSLVIRGEA